MTKNGTILRGCGDMVLIDGSAKPASKPAFPPNYGKPASLAINGLQCGGNRLRALIACESSGAVRRAS